MDYDYVAQDSLVQLLLLAVAKGAHPLPIHACNIQRGATNSHCMPWHGTRLTDRLRPTDTHFIDALQHSRSESVVHCFSHLEVVGHESLLLLQEGLKASVVLQNFGGHCWRGWLFSAEKLL